MKAKQEVDINMDGVIAREIGCSPEPRNHIFQQVLLFVLRWMAKSLARGPRRIGSVAL